MECQRGSVVTNLISINFNHYFLTHRRGRNLKWNFFDSLSPVSDYPLKTHSLERLLCVGDFCLAHRGGVDFLE